MNWKLFAFLVALHLAGIGHASGRPAMFWFNDPTGPDETVLVTGADLNEVTSATVARIGDASAPERETPVEILQANPLSLKFVIPKEFNSGIYRFTLSYPQGAITGRINLPTVYWTQGDLGDSVSAGGWLQVFGRNIVRQSDRAQLVLIADNAQAPIKTVMAKGDLWRGMFRIPDQIPAGLYRVRLTNGDGGDKEWVDAGSVTVRVQDREPDSWFDVRAYGAKGDGKVDNTRAIKATIEAAKEGGGGIVYFPRGRYLVSETLVIPPHVHLRGERTDLVNIFWPDFDAPPPALLQGSSHFSIEDLTIYASNHFHVVVGGFLIGDIPAPDASDIAIRRVRIRASAFHSVPDAAAHPVADVMIARMKEYYRVFADAAPDTLRLSGNGIEISDCDILGSGHSLRLVKATNAIVSGNFLNNGRNGAYQLVGSRRIIFENNLVTGFDLQATGGGTTTMFKDVTSSENIFVGNNTFKAFYGQDREAFTTDGPGGYYYGRAESISPNSLSLLTDANPNPRNQNWAGAMVMVVNGRGTGQYGRISSQTSAGPKMSITLDRPLQVALDQTSEITIVQAHQNYLVVNNSFEDTGVAAQAYGTAVDHVIAGNRSNRTSGFAAIGLSYGHFQPCWQVQILNNHILEGNVYRAGPDRDVYSNEALIFIRANRLPTTPAGEPPMVRGVIARGNQLDQDAHIVVQGFSPAAPGIQDVIVEANTTGPSRIGLFVDRGVAFLLTRRNDEAGHIGR